MKYPLLRLVVLLSALLVSQTASAAIALATISMVWTFGMMALRKTDRNGHYHCMRDI